MSAFQIAPVIAPGYRSNESGCPPLDGFLSRHGMFLSCPEFAVPSAAAGSPPAFPRRRPDGRAACVWGRRMCESRFGEGVEDSRFTSDVVFRTSPCFSM